MSFDKDRLIQSQEQELEQVLRNFRQSVHEWSNAEFSRPRSVASASLQRTWRTALVWALGCVIAVGSVAGGLLERHHQQQLARQAVERDTQILQAKGAATPAPPAAQDEQIAVALPVTADEDLLAVVDSDVSRQVPSAMEPLAQLMENDANQ